MSVDVVLSVDLVCCVNDVVECGCGVFTSSSVCAACDRHWEQHETFFETERERKENGLPYGVPCCFILVYHLKIVDLQTQ